MKKTKKKKYSFGSVLEQNQRPLFQGAMLAGMATTNPNDLNDTSSSIGTGLQRAGQLGQLGSMVGPEGAAIGAGLGLVEGSIEGIANAKSNRNNLRKLNAQKDAIMTNRLISNAGSALAKGGRIKNKIASKLGVIKGGELNSISKDAVEVKANNPEQVDSVELENAYVDHNEVIDKDNRVFSDELGFAKEAKKLEKQKNKNPRFSKANQLIDDKLDTLFQTQEDMKKNMKVGGEYELGGRLRLTTAFPMKPLKSGLDGEPGYLKMVTGNDPYTKMKGKIKYALGGKENELDPYTYNTAKDSMLQDQGSTNLKSNVDFNKGLTDLATFAPNLISGLAQRRLVGPAAPTTERNIFLKRINPDAQLVDADLQANQANQLIKNNTGQAGDLASATGNILAKKLYNRNQIYNQNQNINAQIQHQEAGLNSTINARNVERTNEFLQGQNEFSNLKQRLNTENASNLSAKVLEQGREKNQMELDRDKALYTSLGFSESGVQSRGLERLKNIDPETYKRLKGQGFFHNGGKLVNREIHDGGQLTGIMGLYSHPEPHPHFHFENNEEQNLNDIKEGSRTKLAKGGKIGIDQNPDDYDSNGELKRGRMYGGELEYTSKGGKIKPGCFLGGDGDKPKNSTSKPTLDDFKRISWKSQGVTDSTGRGSMYKTTYGALNKLNRTPIPAGASPVDEAYVQNPLGLNTLGLSTQVSKPLDISGSIATQQGNLAHFKKGGKLKKSKDMRSIPEMTDPQILSQTLNKGGSIHINPKNKGKFNVLKKRTGKTTEQLKHSKNPLTRKRATFAANAKKWHHENGGHLGDPRHIKQDSPSGEQLGARRRITMENIDNVNQRKGRRKKEGSTGI